jgi:hypothetical protein
MAVVVFLETMLFASSETLILLSASISEAELPSSFASEDFRFNQV